MRKPPKIEQSTKIISFIGFLAGAIPLIGLPSNPGIRMLVETGTIIGAAGVIYALHYSIYGMIMQTNSPSGAEILSWVAMLAFIVSYAALRLAGILWKAQGRWNSKLSRVTAFVLVLIVGLVLTIVAYPYLAEPDQFQVYSSGGDAPEEHAESNSAEPSRHSLVIRSETTGDVWVIEAERADDDWPVEVGRDTVYLASATIVGLATFGSLVSVRIISKPKTHGRRTLGLVLMYTGALTVIGYHSYFMYSACCGSTNVMLFVSLFVLTVLGLVFVAFGSFLILDSELTGEKKPPSTQK